MVVKGVGEWWFRKRSRRGGGEVSRAMEQKGGVVRRLRSWRSRNVGCTVPVSRGGGSGRGFVVSERSDSEVRS